MSTKLLFLFLFFCSLLLFIVFATTAICCTRIQHIDPITLTKTCRWPFSNKPLIDLSNDKQNLLTAISIAKEGSDCKFMKIKINSPNAENVVEYDLK